MKIINESNFILNKFDSTKYTNTIEIHELSDLGFWNKTFNYY